MRISQRYLILGFTLTAVPVGVVSAPTASADCVNAGRATVCAQGTVTGEARNHRRPSRITHTHAKTTGCATMAACRSSSILLIVPGVPVEAVVAVVASDRGSKSS